MDGFWEGVQYYNQQKGKNVQVLGWNEADQKGGTFADSFTDQNKGKQISQTFIQQGADIIFPVAGGAGLGAGAAAQAAGGKVNVIWVDTDGCVCASQFCQYFITSVTKNLSGAVQTYVTAAAGGTFPTGNYVGDLENDGTGLAPFHHFDSKVPADLKAELDKVKADIISGTIKVTSPSQPKSSLIEHARASRRAAPVGGSRRREEGDRREARAARHHQAVRHARRQRPIDLVVEPGEIHALLGENGAGKSHPDERALRAATSPTRARSWSTTSRSTFRGPGDAMARRHRHGAPALHARPGLHRRRERRCSATRRPARVGFLDRRARPARRRARSPSATASTCDPDALVEDLPVGVQQRVEIIKALIRDATVLILDEPTAVLTPQETDELIDVMRALQDGGTSIVFITHKLREVRAVADRITVIRRGKVVGERRRRPPSTTELAALMVGRAGAARPSTRTPPQPGDVVLDVERPHRRSTTAASCSSTTCRFQVRGGEIFALAGVQGNGQTELTEALVGLTTRRRRARSRSTGADVTDARPPTQSSTLGVGYVPEDRLHDGLVGDFSVAENLVLDLYDQPPFASRACDEPRPRSRSNATERVDEFDVRTPSIDTPRPTRCPAATSRRSSSPASCRGR